VHPDADTGGTGMGNDQPGPFSIEKRNSLMALLAKQVIGKPAEQVVLLGPVHMQRSA
jgi:hypothetical protein